ncbi:MAG: HEAT repeat domain-containing protein [Phycisphaerae bacterium]
MSLFLLATTVPNAAADSVHLKTGGLIEGDIIAETDEGVSVRTTVGLVTLPSDVIEKIERGPSVFQDYAARKANAPDTPADQFALAEWCGQNDLSADRRRHIARALELDPDFAPARRALGQVRVGALWVDGRASDKPTTRPDKRATTQDDSRNEDDKIAAAIQSQWTRRIRAIRTNMLDASSDRLRDEGRTKILAIDDPLAILPLARELIGGDTWTRGVLIESLTRFPQDESTMNLALTAIVDPSPDLRRAALTPLIQRQDARVAAQYRKALRSDNDELIRRAAISLGVLRDALAPPDLVDVLTVRRIRAIEVPFRRYFNDYPEVFNKRTVVTVGARQYSAAPRVGVISGLESGNPILPNDSRFEARVVTVYRSEVLDALAAITGQNFGFDEPAWRRWLQEFDQWKANSGLSR